MKAYPLRTSGRKERYVGTYTELVRRRSHFARLQQGNQRLTKSESGPFVEGLVEYKQTSVLSPWRLPERLPTTLPGVCVLSAED